MRKSRLTINGTIEVYETDQKGIIEQVAIDTHQDKVYIPLLNKNGCELRNHIHKNVRVHGTPLGHDYKKNPIIRVHRAELLKH